MTIVLDTIEVDLVFTQPLDFTAFDYMSWQSFNFSSYPKVQMGSFNATYSLTSDRSYKISMKLKDFTFLTEETITVKTNNSGILFNSSYRRPFYTDNYEKTANVNWTYIKLRNMSDSSENLTNAIADLST